MARPTAASIRAGADQDSGMAKTATQLDGAGLLPFLANIAPIANTIEADHEMIRHFLLQAEQLQPAPPQVRDGLQQIAGILARATDEVRAAALEARSEHRQDWARAEEPVKNQFRGDVRETMRDGSA